jgi:hypothetical protein
VEIQLREVRRSDETDGLTQKDRIIEAMRTGSDTEHRVCGKSFLRGAMGSKGQWNGGGRENCIHENELKTVPNKKMKVVIFL